MKKQILKSALFALASVGLMSGSALALTIQLESGTGATSFYSINDGDNAMVTDGVNWLFDTDNDSGQVGWSGNVKGWDVSVATGTSYPTYQSGTVKLNLVSFDANNTGTTESLIITLMDSFTGNNSITNFTTWINSTNNNLASTTYQVTIEDAGGIYYSSSLFSTGSGNYDWSEIFGNGGDYSSFNIKMVATLSSGSDTSTSFDATTTTNAVPEPATLLLFGAGIAGLAGAARRKSNNQ